jgi:hypothetical protein
VAVVWIPSLLRHLTAGAEQVAVPGTTLRQVINGLEAAYPGIRGQLLGEGGAFVEGGRVEWPDGERPINTSGGNLAEAYIHGFQAIPEAVRQVRGTSTCQVKDVEISFVAAGYGRDPASVETGRQVTSGRIPVPEDV